MATHTPAPPASDNFGGDPFAHTTMSFGEHLDELRVSLFKAVLSLAVGFAVGLYFNGWIVNLIQTPLKKALVEHAQNESLDQFRKELAVRAAHGDAYAEGLLANPNLAQLVNEQGMLPDEVYIAPREVLAELKERYPDALAGVELPEPPVPQAEQGQAQPAPAAGQTAEENRGAGGQAASGSERPFSKSDLMPIHLWRSVLKDDRTKLISTGSQETFMIAMKAGFLGGAILSSPLVFYFFWSFIAAGLYPHEKYYVQFFLPFSVGLFLLGAALAFFFVFTPVLRFFFGYNDEFGVSPGAADQRVAELSAADDSGLWHQLSIAAGDAVSGADRHPQRANLPGQVEDLGVSAGHLVDGAQPGGRSDQHDADAGAAGRPVLCRHCAVQMAAGAADRFDALTGMRGVDERRRHDPNCGGQVGSGRIAEAAGRLDGFLPRSPVRMRMQSSSGRTKILPSPISPLLPLRPPLMMALIVGSTNSSLTAIWSCTLRSRLTAISWPR